MLNVAFNKGALKIMYNEVVFINFPCTIPPYVISLSLNLLDTQAKFQVYETS